MLRPRPYLFSIEALCLAIGHARPIFSVRLPSNVHPDALDPRVVRL